MNKLITILILLSFVTPVHARMIMQQDPIESDLVTQKPQESEADQKKKRLEEDMNREYKQPAGKPAPEQGQAGDKPGSDWWKWALGIVVISGVVAAAGSGHGGGGGSGGGGGTVVSTW
jgi:hypothetical protein